jgi:DNA-binding transcriptional ArsR family regulator
VLTVEDPTQLRALADPLRAKIVILLKQRAASTTELAGVLDTPKGTVGHHLKVLEKAGLISRTRKATTRLSHLEADPLRHAAEWLIGYREYWEESHARLDALLAALQVSSKERNPR